MAESIFINYRRGEDQAAAGRLYDQLEATFTRERIFIDVDNIAPGRDFTEELATRVAQCDIFLAVVGKRWADVVDVDGSRRLDNPNDWVRVEIESAQRLGKHIIPVLVDGAEMPRPEKLPDALQPFARRNAARLTHERFRADVQALVVAIGKLREAERARLHAQPSTRPRDAEAAAPAAAGRRIAPTAIAALAALAAIAAGAGVFVWRSSSPSPVAIDASAKRAEAGGPSISSPTPTRIVAAAPTSTPASTPTASAASAPTPPASPVATASPGVPPPRAVKLETVEAKPTPSVAPTVAALSTPTVEPTPTASAATEPPTPPASPVATASPGVPPPRAVKLETVEAKPTPSVAPTVAALSTPTVEPTPTASAATEPPTPPASPVATASPGVPPPREVKLETVEARPTPSAAPTVAALPTLTVEPTPTVAASPPPTVEPAPLSSAAATAEPPPPREVKLKIDEAQPTPSATPNVVASASPPPAAPPASGPQVEVALAAPVAKPAGVDLAAMTPLVAAELRRLGCYNGAATNWDAVDLRLAVDKFAELAKLATFPAEPDVGLLAALKSEPDHFCSPTVIASAPPTPPPTALAASEPQVALAAPVAKPAGADLAAMTPLVAAELRRLGCYAGAASEWDAVDLRLAVDKFAELAKLASIPAEPDVGFLAALKREPDHFCAPQCSPREVASGGRCVPKTCAPNQILARDGACVARQPKPQPATAARAPAAGKRCFSFNGSSYCE
jgi:hypothetical protein